MRRASCVVGVITSSVAVMPAHHHNRHKREKKTSKHRTRRRTEETNEPIEERIKCHKKRKEPEELWRSRARKRINEVKMSAQPGVTDSGWETLGLARKLCLEFLASEPDQLTRIDGKKYCPHEFKIDYEEFRLPVIITGLTDNWPAKEKWTFKVLQFNFICEISIMAISHTLYLSIRGGSSDVLRVSIASCRASW
uniref:Cupin_8 domain-containing protein n=1 Tax=Steinernema glaseri TaxID=37863 RepID=A0A1I7ZM33_9BILA